MQFQHFQCLIPVVCDFKITRSSRTFGLAYLQDTCVQVIAKVRKLQRNVSDKAGISEHLAIPPVAPLPAKRGGVFLFPRRYSATG